MENYVDKTVANNTYYNRLYDNRSVYDFFLMHRSKRVALVRFKIDSKGVKALRIKVINQNFLPVRLMALETPRRYMEDIGRAEEQYRMLLNKFNEWMKDRQIPTNRNGIDDVIKNLGGFAGEIERFYDAENVNKKEAILSLMSIFSYNRCMTDKYWLCPVNSKNGLHEPIVLSTHKNLFVDYGINVATSDIILKRKDDYTGMDFNKNGFSNSFYENVIKRENISAHIHFNFPDLCTSGKTKKYFLTVNNNTYMKKLYDNKTDAKDIVYKALRGKDLLPDIFPTVYTVNNADEIGYMTKCFCDGYTEIVTFKDICLWHSMTGILDEDTLLKNAETMNMDLDVIKEIIVVMKSLELPIYENAGVIMDCRDKKVVNYIAWA